MDKLEKSVPIDDQVYSEAISVWNDTYVGHIERDRSFAMAIHTPEVQTYLVEFCGRLKTSDLVKGEVRCWA